jgi:hypothetical protein
MPTTLRRKTVRFDPDSHLSPARIFIHIGSESIYSQDAQASEAARSKEHLGWSLGSSELTGPLCQMH